MLGCADLHFSSEMHDVLEKNEHTTVLACNHGNKQVVSRLRCQGDVWVGELKNCTDFGRSKINLNNFKIFFLINYIKMTYFVYVCIDFDGEISKILMVSLKTIQFQSSKMRAVENVEKLE